MNYLIIIFIGMISQRALALGGYEKSTLWSPRAAQHGGAYASSVNGAEALYYNPASLMSDEKKEIQFGVGVTGGATQAPIVKSGEEQKDYTGPIIPMSLMYSQRISEKEAIGIGLYSIGGNNISYRNVDLSSLGTEFSSFRPDVFGRLGILELGLGYSRQLNSNFSIGATLRNHVANGGFSQVQVIEDNSGNVLAASTGKFDDLKGSALGSYTLGLNYRNDAKEFGAALVYRSKVAIELETKSKGKIIYSNAGALATGANAGQIYTLSGSDSTIASAFPEALTFSLFKKINDSNKAHFEYVWAEYSDNKELQIGGTLQNPVDGVTSELQDVRLNWHDMHEFKLGWTNTSVDKWIIGGGYSFTLPVTDRETAGAPLSAPGNYHNIFLGAGKRFEEFRIDGAYETYFGSGNGQTEEISGAGVRTPSVKGNYGSRAYSFIASVTYFL